MPKNYLKNGEESVKGHTVGVRVANQCRERPCGGGGGDAVGVALCKVSQGDDSTPLECLLE